MKHQLHAIVALTVLGLSTQVYADELQHKCDGIVSADPARMYDFKLGDWNINWRNKTSPETVFEFDAVSKAYTLMDGDIMFDEQTSDVFKGVTFRTYDPANKIWIVRWLPANSDFPHPISAKLEGCTPVERHHQTLPDGREVMARTSFTEVTKDRFLFRQDWSFDEGKNWVPDVLFYEATRTESAQ